MSVTKVTGMMSTSTKGGDIPSASTLVIDTDGDFFDITGTTGITAMTVDAGRRFTLQFDGAVVLTHGSSLYLPGAVNFTTEANDSLNFIATAANTVRCTGYALKDGGSPVAAAGGGLIYLAKATASGSSTVDFLNNFSSTYDNYVIFMDGVIMSTENVGLLHMRMVTGGSSPQTGTNYSIAYKTRTDTAADNDHQGSGGVYVKLQPVGTGNGTGENYGGRIDVYGANEASNYTLGNVQYSIFGNAERLESGHGAFCWEVVTAVTGVQFVPNTGTISEGNFTLFGVAKA
jgi:hypothetical protein